MKPSAKQLIESVAWSLDNKVAPVVEDKWAGSTLRSVSCLLKHLAVRVEVEGQLLFDDNTDLVDLLRRVLDLAEASRSASAAACGPLITTALDRSWREPDTYPTVGSLNEENEALRWVVDRLLVMVRDADDDPAYRDTAVDLLEGYVRRRLQRDQPMFLPAFMASNF